MAGPLTYNKRPASKDNYYLFESNVLQLFLEAHRGTLEPAV